jgi:tetratricopeptide (TPR) repeat protein
MAPVLGLAPTTLSTEWPAGVSAGNPGAPGRTQVPGWRELWQAPVFCMGLILLLLVWRFSPEDLAGPPGSGRAYALAQLALDKDDPADAERLFKILEAGSADGKVTPAQSRFLRTSILLAQTRRRFPIPTQTDEARAAYQALATEFEALQNILPPPEQPRLRFRLLVSRLAAGPPAAPVLDELEQLLETDFADRRDGFELIGQCRASLSPPDLPGAIRALDQLLALPEQSLPPRTRGGEWGGGLHGLRLMKAQYLARLEKWPEVAKTAALIPADAEDEYRSGLRLRALAEYHQKHWGEAVKLWSLIPPGQQTATSLLYLGLCQQQLKDLPAAVRLWERLRLEYPQSPESVRGGAALARWAMQQGRWTDAATLCAQVLRWREPGHYENAYLPAADVRRLAADLAASLLKLHRWDDLRLLGEAALAWSENGNAEGWLAQAWHATAASLPSPVPQPGTPPNSDILWAGEAYRRAADYALRAAAAQTGTARRQSLQMAGEDALRAKAYTIAQASYGELLTLDPGAVERPQILLGLAAALQGQGQLEFARDRLQEALQTPGPHEPTARLRLAAVWSGLGRRQEAEEELGRAARLVSQSNSADAATAAHAWALQLYEQARIHRQETLRAIDACEAAIQHAGSHPHATLTRYMAAELMVDDAKFQLSDMLREQAQRKPVVSGGDPDEALLKAKAQRLWTAYRYFQETQSGLAAVDPRPRWSRFVPFGQIECLYYLGLLRPYAPSAVPKSDACWAEASQICEQIVSQSDSKPDVLQALYWLCRCQRERGLAAEMRETIRRALQYVEEMADSDFIQSPEASRYPDLHRQDWRNLLQRLLEANS